MNTRLGKSFGLAFVVAVGILALMFALGTFSAQKAAAQDVADATVTVQPKNPTGGEETYVRVNFTITSNTGSVVSGQEISITLTGFEIPADIPTSEVSIRAGAAGSVTTGSPAAVSVSGNTITLEIGTDSDGVPMSIEPAAPVSVIFTKRVGIIAPIAAQTYDVTVAAGGTSGTTGDGEAFEVLKTVNISPDNGASGTDITVTGTSFTDGAATIHWTSDSDPADGDGLGAATEIGKTNISGGKFTATISVEAPPFVNGPMNYIHVRDAAGDSAAAGKAFTLNGKVTAPETMVKGSVALEVELEEATVNADIDSVTIGGVSVLWGIPGTADVPYAPALTQTGVTTGDQGSVTININVPGTVATGSKELALFNDANPAVKLGSTMVEITALAVSLTPSTAVPGQTVDLDGAKFTASGTIGTLTVDAEDVEPKPTNTATTNGRFFVTFKIPDVGDGTHVVQLIDDMGKIGEGTVTVPKPTITIDPPSSRRGTPVKVSGTGFPAADSINITYDGADSGFARSDSSGNWEAVITVPPSAAIGEESNIVAERKQGDSGDSRKSDAVKHMVPESELTLSTAAAPSGEMITITGTGFPPYSGITVEFGSNGASPVGVNTDENGDFTAQVQVPLLNPGTSHLVKVVVGGPTGKTVTELFTIASTPVVTVQSSADAFADLIAADNLIVVWYFDNDTKAWSFYDPRPEVAAAVDLTEVDSGDIVWIQVGMNQEFPGVTPSSLTAGWNQVTIN